MNFYGYVDTAGSSKSFPAWNKALVCMILEMTFQVQVCVVPYTILVYLENGTLERTVCLHQILC